MVHAHVRQGRKMTWPRTLHLVGLVIVVVFPPVGLPTVRAQQEALSSRIANYTIEVQLDPVGRMLHGKEVVVWRNDKNIPARELWFHLYWNAWKNNESTWLREDALSREEPRMLDEDNYSFVQVISMRVLPEGPFREAELNSRMRYESPDDGNPDDQTVLVVSLPRSVRSKEVIHVEIVWQSKIPHTIMRSGYRGNFFFLGQWFPKIGVYQPDGTWNCHQFHATTEFFSDFGVYDVEMTVPTGWKVGATGVEVKVEESIQWAVRELTMPYA